MLIIRIFLLSCETRFNRNHNRNLQTSKAPLESQAQGTSLFTIAASSQRGCPKISPREVRVRFPKDREGMDASESG